MNNKITYHREGDYLISDLYLPKQPEGHIGKYGRLRLKYLKNFDRRLYTELVIDGTLKQYLLDIDEKANNKVNLLIKQLAESKNINEQLKEHHQIEWVQAMNNIKHRAEEIVLNEIIYV
jgi:tnpV protein